MTVEDIRNETEEQRRKRERKQANTVIWPTISTNFLLLIIGYLVTALLLFISIGLFYLLRENLFAPFIGEYSEGINPTVFAVITLIILGIIIWFMCWKSNGDSLEANFSNAVKEENFRFVHSSKLRAINITFKILAVLHALLAVAILIYFFKVGAVKEFETIVDTVKFCAISYPFVPGLILICLSMWDTVSYIDECPSCHLLYTKNIVTSKHVGSETTNEKLRGQYHFGGTEKIGTITHKESGMQWDIERKYKGYFEEHDVTYETNHSLITLQCRYCGHIHQEKRSSKHMVSK